MNNEQKSLALTRRLNFRIDEETYRNFAEKVETAGLTSSEFFRDVVCKNKTQIIARPPMTNERKEAFYIVSKAGNNINQIAKSANIAHQSGQLSDKTYADFLDRLDRLTQYMKVVADHVS